MEERPISVNSFEKFLNEDKLMGCKCKECGTLFLPPRTICFKCHAKDLEWAQIKGGGKLLTFTSINIGPAWMVEQGFIPYEIVDILRRPLDGAMGQCDILFGRVGHPLLADNRWAET